MHGFLAIRKKDFDYVNISEPLHPKVFFILVGSEHKRYVTSWENFHDSSSIAGIVV